MLLKRIIVKEEEQVMPNYPLKELMCLSVQIQEALSDFYINSARYQVNIG